jgi:hypothetical protein
VVGTVICDMWPEFIGHGSHRLQPDDVCGNEHRLPSFGNLWVNFGSMLSKE